MIMIPLIMIGFGGFMFWASGDVADPGEKEALRLVFGMIGAVGLGFLSLLISAQIYSEKQDKRERSRRRG